MKSETPARTMPDEAWCDAIASYSAEELIAGELIAADQFEFVRSIIAQQAYVFLVSNCYPAGDLNASGPAGGRSLVPGSPLP